MDSTERAEIIQERIRRTCEYLDEINDKLEQFSKLMDEAITELNSFLLTTEQITERFNIQYEPQTLDDILFPPDDGELKGGG